MAARASSNSIAETFRVKAGARDAQLLITIDQAEELFTVTPEAEAKEFWRLIKLATAETSPFLTLMILRSDYLGMLQKAVEGITRFEEFSLGPMPLDRVRQIIEGPARVAGLRVEDALITAAAADAGSDDALPLLAFTLRELYDRYGARGRGQGERQLLLAHYNELGDPAADLSPLENSVRKRADEVIAAMNPSAEELEALRDAFVGPLVRVNDKGEYVRHPARPEDLPVKAQPILKLLTDARLIVTRDDDGRRTVEVAHEALLRKWPRLRGWLDDEHEFLIGKSRLENALADWENASDADKPQALLQGLALSKANQWLLDHPHAITDAERRFIKASELQAKAERRRKTKNRIALAAGALLVLVGAGVTALQINAARRESEALQRGVDATRLAFQSGVALGGGNVPEAVRTALKAEDTLSTPETRSALLQSLLALSPHLATSLTVQGLRPQLIARLPDSKDMLIGGQAGGVERWDPGTFGPSTTVTGFKPADAGSSIAPALRALSPVGEQSALAVLDDGRLLLFDASNGRELAKPAKLADDIGNAAIGESGAVVVASSVSTAQVSAFACTRAAAIEPRLDCKKTVIASGYADAVAVSERAGRAAVALEDGALTLVNLETPDAPAQRIELPNAPRIGSLGFDATGTRLAVGTRQGQIYVLDQQGNRIALPQQSSNIIALAFDPGSTRLATACDGFAVCIWKLPRSLADGGETELIVKLVGHTNTVTAIAFGPGNDAVMSTGVDESVKAWTLGEMDKVDPALPAPSSSALTDLDVSFDRRWLAAGNESGEVAVWDLKSFALLRSLAPLRDAAIGSLRWHPRELKFAQADRKGWLAIRAPEDEAKPIEIKIDESGSTIDVARWLPDGNSLLAGLLGGEIRQWTPGQIPVAFAARHPDAVQGLAIDAPAGRLYSTDSFGNLWDWNLATREKLGEFPASGEAEDNLGLTKDGRMALAAGNGDQLFLYDLEKKQIVHQLEVGTQTEGAAFSPDDMQIAAVDIAGKLHIWLFPSDELFAAAEVYPKALRGEDAPPVHLDRLTWLPELSSIALSTSIGEVKLISYDVAAWRSRGQKVFVSK